MSVKGITPKFSDRNVQEIREFSPGTGKKKKSTAEAALFFRTNLYVRRKILQIQELPEDPDVLCRTLGSGAPAVS